MKYGSRIGVSRRASGLGLWLFISLAVVAASASMAARPVSLPIGAARPANLPGLENVFHVSEKLYSGAKPEGKAGFESLRALGIRTIICVDGVRPDVEMARRYGMRYVHLPFGYDGCPVPRALEITRAVRDLPGPVYLHCHHGKIRAATAAALVHIALDGATHAQAVAFMRRAGAPADYAGLYRDAETFRRPTAAEIDRASNQFPQISPLPTLAATMVQIDARFAALQACQQAGWRSQRDHPAEAPSGEALQLKELFHEIERTGVIAARPADFRAWMGQAERGAATLQSALRAGAGAQAGAALAQIGAQCDACHARYRNVPQSP